MPRILISQWNLFKYSMNSGKSYLHPLNNNFSLFHESRQRKLLYYTGTPLHNAYAPFHWINPRAAMHFEFYLLYFCQNKGYSFWKETKKKTSLFDFHANHLHRTQKKQCHYCINLLENYLLQCKSQNIFILFQKIRFYCKKFTISLILLSNCSQNYYFH